MLLYTYICLKSGRDRLTSLEESAAPRVGGLGGEMDRRFLSAADKERDKRQERDGGGVGGGGYLLLALGS